MSESIILHHTYSDICFIHYYIPVRDFPYNSKEDVDFSRELWDYKKLIPYAMEKYTDELMQAISQMSRNISKNKIGLVAVPPSKVDKESAVRNSIKIIKEWYDQGLVKRKYGCDKQIYDYSDLLSRVEDIQTSHESRNRPSYDDQMDTIACSRDRLWRYRTAFIILDDVTTLGTSMDVCRDILIENEADEDQIYRLALARTK
ncbi:hypothetical protein SAMN04487760_10529 [Lachnospiraceae bacterium G41]|nr:hypothetical protein SAMN04487760_10529 [Lachnospiraceae bacterium G41]